MRFRYLGNKDEMTAFGYDFSGGNTPDVADPHAIKKLRGNSHFECVEPLMVETQEGEIVEVPVIRKKGGRPRKVRSEA